MTNRDKFLAVVTAANVPVLVPADYKNKTFHTGFGERGGAFLSLPVTVEECINGTLFPKETSHIMVWQRYVDDANVFTIRNEPYPMSRENFLIAENGDHDFSLLEKLLAKETLQFNDYCYEGGNRTIDPDNWVKVTLQ